MCCTLLLWFACLWWFFLFVSLFYVCCFVLWVWFSVSLICVSLVMDCLFKAGGC